jgi:hypothetical protein
VGESVPAKATIAFEKAKQIAATCRQIHNIVKLVDEICHYVKRSAERRVGFRLIDAEYVVMRLMDAVPKLEEAKGHLWINRAAHVCPFCHGKQDQCDCCKGEGWTAKHVWEQAPGNTGKAK